MQRALLLLLVCASYLLFAGAPPWTAGPLLALTAVTAAVAPRRTFAFPRVFRPIDLTLAAAAGILLLQLIPLPRAGVDALSPHAVPVRAALSLSSLIVEPAGWTTLSIDADATARALGTLVIAVLSFWSARAAFKAGGSRRFCRWLALIGAGASLLALYHQVMTPRFVLGVLEPEARSANPFGAFVNRNHFAAWLLMMAAPVGGYLIAHVHMHPGYRRWRSLLREAFESGGLLVAMAGLLMVGVLLLTLSRSALAGVGASGLCGWLFVRRRTSVERPALPLMIAVAGMVLLAGALFVDVDKWVARVGSGFTQEQAIGANRAVIWRETVRIIQDFPLTGTGAGTFSEAMTVYQQTRLWVGSMGKWAHFNNAHSHYLQVTTEGGLLLALVTLVGLVWLFVLGRRAINADRGEIFWVRVGAGAGLAGIAFQSVWEVPLVMPANAILCGVLAGLLLHERATAHNGSYEDSGHD